MCARRICWLIFNYQQQEGAGVQIETQYLVLAYYLAMDVGMLCQCTGGSHDTDRFQNCFGADRCHCLKDEKQLRCTQAVPWSCGARCSKVLPCGHICKAVSSRAISRMSSPACEPPFGGQPSSHDHSELSCAQESALLVLAATHIL